MNVKVCIIDWVSVLSFGANIVYFYKISKCFITFLIFIFCFILNYCGFVILTYVFLKTYSFYIVSFSFPLFSYSVFLLSQCSVNGIFLSAKVSRSVSLMQVPVPYLTTKGHLRSFYGKITCNGSSLPLYGLRKIPTPSNGDS